MVTTFLKIIITNITMMIIIIITLPRSLSASPSGGWSAVRGTRSPRDKIPHSPSPSQHQTVQDPTQNTNTHTVPTKINTKYSQHNTVQDPTQNIDTHTVSTKIHTQYSQHNTMQDPTKNINTQILQQKTHKVYNTHSKHTPKKQHKTQNITYTHSRLDLGFSIYIAIFLLLGNPYFQVSCTCLCTN